MTCEGSGKRRMLSVGQEIAREATCPDCGRTLKVRPTRGSSWMHPNPNGSPQATLPRHNKEEI